ncbi:hypothetical protein F8388_012563 [Cannabis sativa]|uniref:Uncharacterized protein n=1 Tax=Cannabis sativa TaxID=3483 RepID=A0A7J6FIP3_CANSA|nr:hypothetical protein F8388_012563 [Cannabis sativa]KAF4370488.1 hypothetical protein G4B88_005209 [Cannabis sativa]
MAYGTYTYLCTELILGESSNVTSEQKLEKKYGQLPFFVALHLLCKRNRMVGITSAMLSASLLKEAIHVISCDCERKTEWGKQAE